MASPDNTNSNSFWTFWTTLPGFITALATLLTAIVSALALWNPWDGGNPPPDGEGPEQAIKDVLYLQYRQINAGDYDDAYALFADRSQQIVSLRQYKAFFNDRPGYTVDPYKITNVNIQSDDTATVEAVFTVDSAVSEPETYEVERQVVREDGQWRVVMRDVQIKRFQAAD
jgi:hypothetical protein